MFRKIKIGAKITGLVIVVVFIAVFAVSFVAYNLSKNSYTESYKRSISLVSALNVQKIQSFFEKVIARITFGADHRAVKNKLTSSSAVLIELSGEKDSLVTPQRNPKDSLLKENKVKDDKNKKTENKKIENKKIENKKDDKTENLSQIIKTGLNTELDELVYLLDEIVKTYKINCILLVNKEGRVIYNTNKNAKKYAMGEEDFLIPDQRILRASAESPLFSNVITKGDNKIMQAAMGVADENLRLLGHIVYEFDIFPITQLADDTSGIGEKGEIILVKNVENRILYNNDPRLLKAEFKDKIKKEFLTSQVPSIFQKIVNKNSLPLFEEYVDERGKAVLAYGAPIPLVEWGIVVKVDKEAVYSTSNLLLFRLAVAGILVALLSMVLGVLFSRVYLVRPLIYLKETINLIAKGILPEKLKLNSLAKTEDEISEMNKQLDELVSNLKVKANFARSIGGGNFNTSFNPASDKDLLGFTLLRMRDDIQLATKRDDERNWIVTGLAEIGDILPSIKSIEELGALVTEYVSDRIGAVQGAFYVVHDEAKNNAYIEMTSSYAYNKKKYLKAKFKFAEGLVGQAAIEKDMILRTEIPDDYMTISSGILGDRKPKCLLITPLITNETVYGVLEFAGFNKFSSREIKFVEEISELIARTIFNIKVRENTEKLLHESEEKSQELEIRQELLRQSNEVMEATQQQLQKTNKELENNIKEVQFANDRIQLLLKNASEVITIYETDGTIRYISPSVEKILGYTQDEMIGIKDIIYVHPSGLATYEQMFKDVAQKDEKITIEFSYKTKMGERIWLEATATNLLNDPAIQGIVLNTRDITERRSAEQEQRLRGQMQALSENSPDLITRISKEGMIFYINPVIETYTGKNKDHYLQKHLKESGFTEDILHTWSDIIGIVLDKNQKVNKEMDFPSIMGDRVMQVNAIPEFNEQNSLESVLVVSHDITERKLIELDIQTKNKKITESINYAKRIQEAILPDTGFIRQFFRESFILYKPKDVVSGDFPWFFQKDDDIYVAAVDCTGHGVPGALISLIGFFLLNNIVNASEASSPSFILDLLDEEVTRTLKQDETDSSTKDGMDISLCKINQKKMQIEYAGAHRPLYYFSDDDLHEIKGNKFPIGGAQYKNRVQFTNTVINYKPGDSIYLFSDGFPDQFGGPKNKKLSPRKIRDIIKDNLNGELNSLSIVLDREFEEWKGNNKQTDDVLFIGIKL